MNVAYLVYLRHNDLAFFDSDLAVNYVTFGSEHRKLVGNLIVAMTSSRCSVQ